MRKALYDKKRVLVFNPLKRLIAIFDSCNSAASTLGASAVSVYYACIGKNIACRNLYFRYLYEDKIELELLTDLGELQLENYDKLVGLERKYYATKKALLQCSRSTCQSNKNDKE